MTISKHAESPSPEPWEPAPDECLFGQPWPISQRSGFESLIPTPEDCERALHFRIDDRNVLRQIGLMRRFLRANRVDCAPRPYPFYAVKIVGTRWAGQSISRGMHAALELEGFAVTLELGGLIGGVFYCWLSLTPELHTELTAVTRELSACIDAAVVNAGKGPD